MANHQPIKDPFAKLALFGGLALILLTVGILVMFLINTIKNNSIDGEIDATAVVANKTAMTAANLKPIGEVTSSDGSGAAPSAARSGEEVYKAVCTACHASGAAGAPKLDDKAAWEPRIATGFDALMNTAINGKGAMPARGGQNVPDGELKAAIAYMTTKAGFSLDIPKDEAAAAPAEEKKAEEAPAAAAPVEEKKTEEAPAAAAPAEEKKTEEAPAAATPAEEKKTEEAPAAAAPAEAAPSTPASPSTPEAPNAVEAPEAPKAPETAANTAAAVTAVVAAATAAPEASAEPAAKESSIDGEAIYKKTCFACHDMGIAGAPKLGDKALWEPRIATGNDALYNSAIKGKTSPAGAMPPKGGNMTLTDDEIKATVDYMVSKAQ